MAGLRKMCRAFGGMQINGVMWRWDYAADEPVKESEMPMGSERWKASEMRKVELMREQAREHLQQQEGQNDDP
jgi:hypothetical protein